MRILHVITGLQKAAGTSVFCGEVCNQLVAAGHDVTIAVCDPTAPDVYPLDPRIHLIAIQEVVVASCSCRKEDPIHSTTTTTPTTTNYNLIHIHALWAPVLHKVACWARAHSIPVVWSPHGMITPWAMKNKWWKKWLGWHLYQKRDLESAALLHVTAESEVEDVRRMGLKNKVVVAPLGVRVSRVEVERCRGERQDFSVIASNWYDIANSNVIDAMQPIRIILSDAALCDRRAVKDVFKSFGLVENAFDGRKVSFPSKSVGKMLGQRGIDLYRVAGSFAELFRAARRAWSETEAEIENHKEHRNIFAYHQYIAKFNDGHDECFIRFTVREERGSRIARNEVHSSTVSRITVYKAKGVELSNLGHAQAEDSTPFVDNKIAYYFARVNGVRGVGVENSCSCRGEANKTLLFVSRVQRKKGLPMLLEAWANLKEKGKRKSEKDVTKGWHIRIVGPDQDGHTAELMSQCDRLGLTFSTPRPKPSKPSEPTKPRIRPQVEFVGPKYGDDLTREYAAADLFVLPTHSENFGSVVIESLAQGVPVVCTKGAPWEELETYKCGRWVDIGVEPLAAALSELLNLSTAERREMGERGRRLVEEKYTWEAVAGKLVKGYEEVLNG